MNKAEITQQRLREREQKLQARANWHLEQAKGNMNYLRTDGVRLIGSDVARDLSEKSPIMAKAVNFVTGNRKANQSKPFGTFPRSQRVKNRGMNIKLSDLRTFEGFKAAVLPIFFTLGSMKLMAVSLKGTRKLLGNSIKRVFGIRKNRK